MLKVLPFTGPSGFGVLHPEVASNKGVDDYMLDECLVGFLVPEA